MRSLLIVLICASCSVQPIIYPATDATCEDMQAHLKALNCDELLTIPGPDELPNTTDDIDWITFCKQFQDHKNTALNIGAALQLSNCGEIAKAL